MRLSLFFWFLSVLIFAQNTFATDKTYEPINFRCGQRMSSDNKLWKYCLHQYPNSSRNVLYYFHGILGSERDWKNHELERNIVRRWVARGIKPPVVVSVSFGPAWLVIEKNPSKHSGLFEILRDEVLPYLKNTVLAFKSTEDWLMGVSMGGFNASQFYFKAPKLFTKSALICPAMTDVSPYTDKAGFDDYISRTSAMPFLVWLSQIITQQHLPDPNDWYKHSPLDLGFATFSRDSRPLYISNGTKDEFGFHVADQALAKLAEARGVPVKSNFYPGQSHCYVDSKPIADFFIN